MKSFLFMHGLFPLCYGLNGCILDVGQSGRMGLNNSFKKNLIF